MTNTHTEQVADFLRYLRVQQGRTVATVRNYQLYLSRLLAWIKEKRITTLSPDQLQNFRLWLSEHQRADGRTLSPATQNYHLIALRSFLKYLKLKGVGKSAAATDIRLMKLNERSVKTLTAKEAERLVATTGQTQNLSLVAVRDQALIRVLLATGLKVSDVAKLNRDNFTNGKIILTKTNQELVLPQTVVKNLTDYLEARHDANKELFARVDRAKPKKGGRTTSGLTARSIERIILAQARAAGLPYVTPSVLRHTYARALIEQGASTTEIKARLGFKHLVSASVYKRISKKPH